MPKTLPQIDYCLACEGLRPEVGGKATILGFFGLLPRVEIILAEWNQPILTLMFLVGTHGGSGDFKVKANVVNPDGSVLASVETPFHSDNASGLNANLGFGFTPVQFSQKGQHSFQLMFDGSEMYKNNFVVKSST